MCIALPKYSSHLIHTFMTTVSPISPISPLIRPTWTAPLPAIDRTVDSSNTTSAPAAGATPATSVTLGRADAATSAPIYAEPKPLNTAPVWARESGDAISSLMAGNYLSRSLATRLQGLGAALLDRFATESGDFSQSVMQPLPGAQQDGNAPTLDPDNLITLDIKTASGATVHLSLGSQDDSLAVQVQVTDGQLDDAERGALEKLSGAFQTAIDGLTAKPPRLDLAGLTQFDPTVLSSVDLHASVKVDANNTQSLDFHADSQRRTVTATSATGTVKVDVDMSNPTLLGGPAQQAQAIQRYLGQVDDAANRGKGDASLVAMFKDAFTEMNSNYGVAAPQRIDAAHRIVLSDIDHHMLTGLADFNASITQVAKAINPAQPTEFDNFTYQTSQSSSVLGLRQADRTITQKQQSHLSAAYHQSLSPDVALDLNITKQSQNYTYHQIDDDASSTAEIGYQDGKMIKASVDQSASRSTHVSKYVMGRLVSDTTTPSEQSRSVDLMALLSAAEHSLSSSSAREVSRGNQDLSTVDRAVLLQTEPTRLRSKVV